MNPLERLRYLARFDGEDPMDLAIEATYVIAEMANDRSMLVSALRRLLDRHCDYGIIWMLAARIAGSVFPEEEAWSLIGEFSTPRSIFNFANSSSDIQVTRNGRIAFDGETFETVATGMDADLRTAWLRSYPAGSLVVASDLVSSRFALVPTGTVSLIEDAVQDGWSGRVTLWASDFSLAAGVIRDSLESRRRQNVADRTKTEVVVLDNSHLILYQGSPIVSAAIERLVRWRVPQEMLRSAGPMLG